MEKQKQILNYLDLELKKINDKVLTLKYVILLLNIGTFIKKIININANPTFIITIIMYL
jgi:hypothetical protein